MPNIELIDGLQQRWSDLNPGSHIPAEVLQEHLITCTPNLLTAAVTYTAKSISKIRGRGGIVRDDLQMLRANVVRQIEYHNRANAVEPATMNRHTDLVDELRQTWQDTLTDGSWTITQEEAQDLLNRFNPSIVIHGMKQAKKDIAKQRASYQPDEVLAIAESYMVKAQEERDARREK